MTDLTDRDILLRLANTEDGTVERKTASDYRDCLKTAVAFSNSMPVGDPAIIFVGVGNDGTPLCCRPVQSSHQFLRTPWKTTGV
jgi:predicted HTH transcriptional regulator